MKVDSSNPSVSCNDEGTGRPSPTGITAMAGAAASHHPSSSQPSANQQLHILQNPATERTTDSPKVRHLIYPNNTRDVYLYIYSVSAYIEYNNTRDVYLYIYSVSAYMG